MVKEERLITRDNIENALKKHDNLHSGMFLKLMGAKGDVKSQKVKTYKQEYQKRKEDYERAFGRNGNDIPRMEKVGASANFRRLVENVQHDQYLKDMLTRSAKRATNDGEGLYRPLTTSPALDNSTVEDTIEKVFGAKVTLEDLPCAELSQALVEEIAKVKKERPTWVATRDPILSVSPPGFLLGLDYMAEFHDTYVNVLRGEVVWIFWPRTAENLSVMEEAYQRKWANEEWELETLVDQLKDGVILGQNAKGCLRLPPLCIYMCVPTEFTVLSRYQLLSASYFVDSLEVQAGFYRSALESLEGPTPGKLFDAHSGRRQSMVGRILNCEYESYKPEEWKLNTKIPGPLNELIQKWDAVKNNVAQLLTRHHAAEVRKSWIEMLSVFNRDQCAICGAHGDLRKIAEEHFDEAHWVDEGQFAPDFPGSDQTAPESSVHGGMN